SSCSRAPRLLALVAQFLPVVEAALKTLSQRLDDVGFLLGLDADLRETALRLEELDQLPARFHAHGLAAFVQTERKNFRMSATSTSGPSRAAKWPPCSSSVQWTMLFSRSAQRRMVTS